MWVGKDMPIYCTHECIRVAESLPFPRSPYLSLSLAHCLSVSFVGPKFLCSFGDCGCCMSGRNYLILAVFWSSKCILWPFSSILFFPLPHGPFHSPIKAIVIGICCYLSKLAKSFICSPLKTNCPLWLRVPTEPRILRLPLHRSLKLIEFPRIFLSPFPIPIATADCPVLAPLNICLGHCQDHAAAASTSALLPPQRNRIPSSFFCFHTRNNIFNHFLIKENYKFKWVQKYRTKNEH